MTSFTLDDVRERTYKKRDAWWTVFLVDPLAGRLVVWTANRTSITPNQITFGAGVLGLLSAACFAMATWPWLVLGGLLFHLSFVLDCMDGKIARLKGTGSVFGAWVDFVFDRIRFFFCLLALVIGQWVHTGDIIYLLIAPVVTFVDMLRYLNGPQMAKTRKTMRRQLRTAIAGEQDNTEQSDPESIEESLPDDQEENEAGPTRQVAFIEEVLREHPELTAAEIRRGAYQDSDTHVIDVHGGFARKFSWYDSLRRFLLLHRVRPHLFSGIEFEMFVGVVAPLTAVVSLFTPWPSLIIPVLAFSCAALLFFETLLVYKLWLATRSFNKEMAQLRPN